MAKKKRSMKGQWWEFVVVDKRTRKVLGRFNTNQAAQEFAEDWVSKEGMPGRIVEAHVYAHVSRWQAF